MTRGEAWFSHAATLVVGGTGLIYGWMRYFAESTDEFAVVNHPLQGTLQGLHILFAPLTVFACGLLWRNHVWARFRSGFRPQRKGGLALMAIFIPMVASGYLVQVSAEEPWRTIWIWLHGVSSVLWILVYLGHQMSALRKKA
jgi:hypothetical protein